MEFDYGSIVFAHATPANSGEWPALMEGLVKQVQNSLESSEEAGWELVSHDFLTSGEELIVTFFTRRPRGAGI